MEVGSKSADWPILVAQPHTFGYISAHWGTPSSIATRDGDVIGAVTSGGFGPSVDGPIAMGYVETAHAKPETEIDLIVRGKPRPGRIVKLPFHPHRYFKS